MPEMDGHWTKERLLELVKERLGDRLFVVVSNREPYVHTLSGDEVAWNQPVSGLTEALAKRCALRHASSPPTAPYTGI